MSRKMVSTLFASAILMFGMAAGKSPTVTYTSIDHEGAKSISASGINARGDIVGSYTDNANVTHGFLKSGDSFVPIDYPDAVATQARGINPQGDIVGTHQGPDRLKPGSGGDIHGFLLRAGTSIFEAIDYPEHMNTIAQRITANGLIFGCYHDRDTMNSMHGILSLSDGSFTALDNGEGGLNIPASMNNGATPDGGVITGLYTDMTGKSRSYIISGGTFTPFDVPGGIATSAWDMNPSGEIVGVYADVKSKVHGFLMTRGEFFTIDYPQEGVQATQAFGINPQGDVVGSYRDSAGVTHGFLLTGTRHLRE